MLAKVSKIKSNITKPKTKYLIKNIPVQVKNNLSTFKKGTN